MLDANSRNTTFAYPRARRIVSTSDSIKSICEAYIASHLAFVETETAIEDRRSHDTVPSRETGALEARLAEHSASVDELVACFSAMRPCTRQDLKALASVVALHEGARIHRAAPDASHDEIILGLLVRGIEQLD